MPRRRRPVPPLGGAILLLTLAGAPAAAQTPEPIGPWVVDVRGALALFGQNAQIASARGANQTELPGRGLGLDLGAHLYPLRWKAITFGVGADLVFARGTRTPDPELMPDRPSFTTRFSAIAPQISFNFGNSEGWSYISGGLGLVTLGISASDGPDESGPRLKAINYGGGARWLTRPHLAFSIDVRFYAISPSEATPEFAGTPRLTWLVVNVGVSLQ